jgi:NAD(P)-dependent dehydrogenase (short-subunit alcohol dehydrogenase family)
MQMSGQVALVTGAGSGIGRATALLLAREGAAVAVVDTEKERVDQVVTEIAESGGRAVGRTIDISDGDAVVAGVEALARELGGLDVVVANAGINGVWAPIDELTPDEWQRTIDVNLTGTFHTIRATVPHLKQRGGGAIVVTSSVQGTSMFSVSGATAYGATKAAQVAMVRYLALELGPHHIRVTAVCPGAVDTNLTQNTEERDTDDLGLPVELPEGGEPLKAGIAEPEHIAEAIVFLASERAARVTGVALTVDGGETLVLG